MDIQHERRSGDERREFALNYPLENERRLYPGRRGLEMRDDIAPGSGRVITEDYWGASDDESTTT